MFNKIKGSVKTVGTIPPKKNDGMNCDYISIDDFSQQVTFDPKRVAAIGCRSKITNGSRLYIGENASVGNLIVDQHFNWLQKLMWKWTFGIKVEDYSEE